MTDEEALLIEQYATHLVDFSNQYGSNESFSYTARNCLGKPDKFPSYGDFPETYVIREISDFFWDKVVLYDRAELFYNNFVDLKFQHKVFVSAIYIYETFNPGAVFAIWGGNSQGDWCLLWEETGRRSFPGHHPRAFSPPVRGCRFPINIIRLIFCHFGIPSFSEIDAVAILGFAAVGKRKQLSSPSLERRSPESLVKLVRKHNFPMVTCLDTGALSLNLRHIGRRLLHEQREQTDNGIFAAVPGEILMKVAEYLDLQSLCRFACVSRLFRQISSDPRLYARVSFRSVFHLACDFALDNLSRRCSHLTHLDLSWTGEKISPSALSRFLLHCGGPELHFLRLNSCAGADATLMASLSVSCPQLVELSLANCLRLNTPDFEPLTQLHSLRNLNVSRTKIGNSQVFGILRGNPGLQCLRLSNCSLVSGDDICQAISELAVGVIALELWRVNNVTFNGVLALSSLSQLRDLDLGWCNTVDATNGCIQELVINCTRLERLILTAHRQTSDRDLRSMGQQLPDLRQLDLMGTRHVTVKAVEALLTQCTKLELLDIGYCDHLDNPETITALRTAYPKCHIIGSFP